MKRKLKGLLALWLAILTLSMTSMAATTLSVRLEPGVGSSDSERTVSTWFDTSTGRPMVVPDNPFTPSPGYEFTGWATTDGQVIPKSPGETVNLRVETHPTPTTTSVSFSYHVFYNESTDGTGNNGTLVAQWRYVGGEESSGPPTINVAYRAGYVGPQTVWDTSYEVGDTVTVRENMFDPPEGQVFLRWESKEVSVTRPGDTFSAPHRMVLFIAQWGDSADGASALGGASGGGYQDCPRDHTCPISAYSDADPMAWYHDGLHDSLEDSVLSGFADGTLRPNAPVSRQQVWMVLARLAGETPADMAAARDWAVAHGITDGANPGDPVSRQQLAVMLYRYAVEVGGLSAITLQEHLIGFADADQIADYAVSALNWAVGQGILNGYEDQTLRPEGGATRAHFAAMIQRFAALMG